MDWLMQWANWFVHQGTPFFGFTISGGLFILGLTLGLRSGMRLGWLLAALSFGYIALRLSLYVQ